MARRFPPLTVDEMSDEQRDLQAWFIEHRGGFVGPYAALLRVPSLASAVSAVGEQIRFSNVLPDDLVELAIIVCVRRWKAAFPWYAHSRLAVKAGVVRAAVDAIGDGADPLGLTDAQRAVYDFSTELADTGAVSDPTYAAVETRFGEAGAVSLTATVGYYGLVSALVNVDRHPVPDGKSVPFVAP